MKTGPEPTRYKMLKIDTIIAFCILIVVAALAAVYSHYHHSAPVNSAQTSAAGWTNYSSSKYGFKFSYPGSWGKPQVTSQSGVKGNAYSISFAPTGTRKQTININMTSADYQRKVCPDGACQVISGAVTSQNIQSDLKDKKDKTSAFVASDNSSYGFITNTPGAGTMLQDEQTVSLPHINVSAAIGTFTLAGTGNCPQNRFAPSGSAQCVSQKDYNTFNQMMKSIQAV